MDLVNQIFDTIFSLIFAPFAGVHPVWPMLVVALLTSFVMLFLYKLTSKQSDIKQAKNHVKAHFLAIRLYRDDVSTMFDTMKNILVSNGRYLKSSLRPMVFLMIPVALILVQVGARYEFRPLQVGEKTILTAKFDERMSDEKLKGVELNLPDGLVLDAPPVRVSQTKEVSWRLKTEQSGRFIVEIKSGEHTAKKEVLVNTEMPALSAAIAKGDLLTTLMNPTEKSLAKNKPFQEISVAYPTRNFEMLGFSTHWLIVFFVASLVFAFGFKGFVGVEV